MNRRFRVVVHRSSGFVKHQHRGVLEDGARQGNALALSTGKALAPFPHQGVVPLRECIDETRRFSQFRGPLDGAVIRMGHAIGNVLSDGAVEQVDVLTDQGNRPAQILELQLLDRATVQEDLSAVAFIKTQQQLDQRAFTRPRCPHNPDGGTSRDDKVEALQQSWTPWVGEVDRFKAQTTSDQLGLQHCGAAANRDGGIDQIENPLGGGHRTLVFIQCSPQGGEGPKQTLGDEHQHAVGGHGQLAVEGLKTTDEENRQKGEQNREANQRNEGC